MDLRTAQQEMQNLSETLGNPTSNAQRQSPDNPKFSRIWPKPLPESALEAADDAQRLTHRTGKPGIPNLHGRVDGAPPRGIPSAIDAALRMRVVLFAGWMLAHLFRVHGDLLTHNCHLTTTRQKLQKLLEAHL